MKNRESILSSRSGKKTYARKGTKSSTTISSANNNEVISKKSNNCSKKRFKTTITMMGATTSNSNNDGRSKSSKSYETTVSAVKKSKDSPRKSNKTSPELRPRRRASQTYFFKYQLAKNPLKAEEEDLKLALLASLQQCSSSCGPTDDDSQGLNATASKKKKKKSKINQYKNSIHMGKRPVGRPPKNSAPPLVADKSKKTSNETFKISKKGQRLSEASSTKINGTAIKRERSDELNLPTRISSLTEEARRKKREYDRRRRSGLLAKTLKTGINKRETKDDKARNQVNSSLSSCNDLTTVQNKIKKAKKLLQNKQANKNNDKAIIGKYTALRKFPSNANLSLSPSAEDRGSSSPSKSSNRSRKKSRSNNCYLNDLSTNGLSKTTSGNQYLTSYSPYAPLQKREPPDEDYLKKYKPDTEDFLTFICFRTTAPNYQQKTISNITTDVNDDSNSCTNSNQFSVDINNRSSDKQVADYQNLKQCNSTLYKMTNSNNNPIINHLNEHQSPSNHRRPTRQSPRLASSNRKISENDSLNHNMGISATAYDSSITYEEDMKRASIALEDMAQEINSSDDIHNEIAQNSPDYKSRTTSPYKNNKHLVKGLMTREFAGAFADEETIFESISNHKL